MDKRQEVPSGLFVAGGDPSVLLHLEPESLGQIPIPVAVPVVGPLLGPVLQAGDHRLGPLRLDRFDDGFAVVAFVGNDHFDRRSLDQGLGLRHVRCLPRCEDQLDGQSQAADGAVNLGPEASPATPEGLFVLSASPVPFFLRRRRRDGRE